MSVKYVINLTNEIDDETTLLYLIIGKQIRRVFS